MKSLHKIILFALLPLMGACSGMLDIEPHSAVSPTVVGSDDIEALRIGMYNKVQEGPTYYSYIAFDLFGGELMTSTGRPIDLINSLSNALHTFVSSQWNGYYKALLQVNNVMSIAEGLADSPTRNRVLGECRYFRAYIYLCLVTRFGDVPVLRQNTQAKVSRDPASMAWELVEEDLDAASGFLNGLSADSFYYVSPAAVTALKARVKLYLGKKGEAKELAESLITNPNYALDDFDKIFRSKANKEVIFAFSCLTEDGSSIKISNQFYSYNHPNKGSYNYRPAGDVMTMYADNDLRQGGVDHHARQPELRQQIPQRADRVGPRGDFASGRNVPDQRRGAGAERRSGSSQRTAGKARPRQGESGERSRFSRRGASGAPSGVPRRGFPLVRPRADRKGYADARHEGLPMPDAASEPGVALQSEPQTE